MPHETFKKIIKKIPAFQYAKKQEERQSKTEQGRELLEKTRTVKGKVRTFRRLLRKKFQLYDE